LVVNPVVATLHQAAERKNMLFCPVQFEGSTDTWWCMVDTGPERSIISSGLVAHLGLLDREGTTVHASNFTVSGYDKGQGRSMPIIATWMRMGTRGDDLRWEKVMFVVLPTDAYKLLLGMDFLENRGGVVETSKRKLTLERDSIKYVLPLIEKRYVLRSTALKKYAQQGGKGPAVRPAVNMVEISDMVADGELERAVNMLDLEEAKYAGEVGLLDILTLQKLCQDHYTTDLSKEAV
jgi:hypothetical protein